MNIVLGIDDLDTKLYIRAYFGPNAEMCSNFYEIWQSQQSEHANYKYNTRQCLAGSFDY